MDILILIVGIIGFAMAIIIHEVAHGLVADRLGDPTARLMGRLTLNPIPHIDLLGTILLPLMLVLFKSPFVFGWAKPVPIDPYNLQNPKKDTALISLAGPAANLILAVILSIFLRIILAIFPGEAIFTLFYYLIEFNIVLAIFNLIPIHPLDGGKILAGILPDTQSRQFDSFMNRFGTIILFLLIFPIFSSTSLISPVIGPVLNFFLRILLPGFSTI